MLNDCSIKTLKYWLRVVPNHTKIVSELIVDNIEKKITSTLRELDLALANEFAERLYKNSHIDKQRVIKIKKLNHLF